MNLNAADIKRKKKRYIVISIVIVLFLLLFLWLFLRKGTVIAATPVLTIETPQKVSIMDTKEIVLDMTISSFGDAVYPAASMSISFDPSKLEFIGVEEGNVFVRNDVSGVPQKLPEWSCNPDQCNKTGKINIMYLDTSGGKNAFSKEFLADEDNVVLRLKFRLRGSIRKGDVCDLIFEDAVFAASDEKESLAMTRKTLKIRNSKIVVGE